MVEFAIRGGAVVKQGQVVKVVVAVVLGLLLLMISQIGMGMGVATLMRESWPTQTPLEARFEALRIKVEDLPLGWHRGGVQGEDVPGATARFLWYYGPPGESKSWINVSQKLILYPSTQAAVRAYDGWVAEYIPPAHQDAWISPPGLEFTSQADKMVVACYEGYINNLHHYACNAIGLYNNTIIVLHGNVFDDRWLTMADFQAVLEAMDQRIVAVLESEE